MRRKERFKTDFNVAGLLVLLHEDSNALRFQGLKDYSYYHGYHL